MGPAASRGVGKDGETQRGRGRADPPTEGRGRGHRHGGDRAGEEPHKGSSARRQRARGGNNTRRWRARAKGGAHDGVRGTWREHRMVAEGLCGGNSAIWRRGQLAAHSGGELGMRRLEEKLMKLPPTELLCF